MSDDFTRMRLTWLDQVFNDANLNSTTRELAFHLSRFFNRRSFGKNGVFGAWPSHETLAAKMGKNPSTVRRAIAALKEADHLSTRGKGGRHCPLNYFAIIHGDSLAKSEMKESSTPSAAIKGTQICAPLQSLARGNAENLPTPASKPAQICAENLLKNEQQTSLKITSSNNLFEPGVRGRDESFELSPARAPIGIVVLSLLAKGPGRMPPLPPFLRGKEKQFPGLVLDEQAKTGWPDLHLQCQDPAHWNAGIARMACELEPVVASKENPLWSAWKNEYRARGWPMPEPRGGIACFPQGGPRKLDKFLERLSEANREAGVSSLMNVVRLQAGRGKTCRRRQCPT